MILAGNLKYKLIFKSIEKVQSKSGAITTQKNVLFNLKAQKIKIKNDYKEDAKEMFFSSVIEFKMRYNKLITTDLIVEYSNDEYRIISTDENKFDNSINIIIEKINK